jgi:hypothetical protein
MMRVLLDTHMLLWAAAMSARLPAQARMLLEDASNEVYCSVASLWEIAIKSALRRPDFDVDLKALRALRPRDRTRGPGGDTRRNPSPRRRRRRAVALKAVPG